MAHPRIIVLGSINADLVIQTPELPSAGQTVSGGEFYQAGGGKGANQAVAAARTSRESVAFIAAVGNDDLGRRAMKELRREGVATQYIRMMEDQPTGVALIMVDRRGENQIAVAPGANACLTPEHVAAVDEELFAGASVFVACLESPIDTVVAGLRRAKAAGLTTVLNPAPACDGINNPEILALVDILTPNESEAIQLSGWSTMEDLEDVCIWCEQLQQKGSREVVITRGARGAIVKSAAGDPCLSAAYVVDAVDATGAGDCFNGALAAGLAEGLSLLHATRFAMAAAALSVTRRGAIPSLPSRDEVDAFLAQDPERAFPSF